MHFIWILQAIPHNSASIEFKLLSVRVEWMTRKVLVAHCVGPTLRLHDEYRTEEARDADGKMVGIFSLKMSFFRKTAYFINF